MHIQTFRALRKEEIAAIDFWCARRRPDAWDNINGLIAEYDENAIEAGPNGSFCEITTAYLQRVEDKINETIDYYIERIKDWASD